ncbi:MAG: hypothetical protein V1706_11720 [Pseudomonadota bacterium]
MTRKILFLLLFSLTIFTLAACMTVQQVRDRRIAASQQTFDSFSPEIQEKVRDGRIEIGFTEEMVRLAWGSPAQTYVRITEKGEATVWTYSRTTTQTQTDRMTVPVRVYDKSGRSSIQYQNVWINRDTQQEYAVARVEFIQGAVSAIERQDL